MVKRDENLGENRFSHVYKLQRKEVVLTRAYVLEADSMRVQKDNGREIRDKL